MEIDFPYALSDQDARSRLELLGAYLAKYLVVKIDGELTLGNGHAQFKGEDPGFLWRNKAKDYIKGKLATYLDPAKTMAMLPTS